MAVCSFTAHSLYQEVGPNDKAFNRAVRSPSSHHQSRIETAGDKPVGVVDYFDLVHHSTAALACSLHR
jgi:hypothetical protein